MLPRAALPLTNLEWFGSCSSIRHAYGIRILASENSQVAFADQENSSPDKPATAEKRTSPSRRRKSIRTSSFDDPNRSGLPLPWLQPTFQLHLSFDRRSFVLGLLNLCQDLVFNVLMTM